jgi:hypothetical protein
VGISLVGDDGAGTIDGDGEFCVLVRDLANLPINNSLVVVDFSNCSTLNICDNNEMGLTVDCGTQTVRGFTSPGGLICMRIKGHANNSAGNTPSNAYNCARIFADGVLLCSPSVAAYDHDGFGLLPSDLSSWLGDSFGSADQSRSDYDFSGPPLLPNDLSLWLNVSFDTNSNGNSVNNCPQAPKGDCPTIP